MPRKKSRPTHRENAATVPSNEVGLYKMFWNSMETNPGANRPNSPSQGDAAVSSAVIIINDSPADSPCAVDENSRENPVVPLSIKEEIREKVEGNSRAATIPENVQESDRKINGDCSSLQTCLPGNSLTSPSKNRSPSSFQSNLITKNPPQNENCASMTPISTCMDISSSRQTSPNEPNTGNSSTSGKPQAAAEDGDAHLKQIEDNQVCDQVTTEDNVEIFSEINVSKVANTMASPTIELKSSQSLMISAPNDISHASPTNEGISENSGDLAISHEGVPLTLSSHTEISETPDCSSEIPDETPMDVISEPQTPAVDRVTYEESPTDEHITDPQFSTVNCVENNEENTDDPPMNGMPKVAFSLLQSLLNAPDEELEAMSELPGLIGHHGSPDPNEDEEQMDEFGLEQDSTYHNHVDVSSMDIAHSTIIPENIVTANGDMMADASHQNQTDDMVVDEEHAEFPVSSSNFSARKIKLDSIGISRTVKFIKERARALYREYLNDDVILRTVIETQTPVVEAKDTSDDVEETPVYPCHVKVERLPDPFVKKSTVVMSDDTFKTWKKQIIRYRNEDKFRHLKVWRRGRTLLWRECELAGMDRATYDEQVAYVKKHKLNENSEPDDDASQNENESGTVYHSNQCDSSQEASSEEETEDSELSYMNLSSSPMKQFTSQASANGSEPSLDSHLIENEYVVESSTSNQSSPSRTPSALKITIRKASLSRSEDDPTEGEENFTVATQPSIHKPRKIATKRTFRRPSDPTIKTIQPSKSTGAETKKSKPVEDLYDQSLLGTRSYEVENFNLLEKWDIPFEAPTLFRSPRAASRLAQLRTKEAFAPSKKYAPSKTTLTPAVTPSNTICREVKDVVEMLCSKTVEAMLFPESKLAGTKKSTKTDDDGKSVDIEDPASHEEPSKPSMPIIDSIIEGSNILDESSEFSQSETNSTIDGSSDFGGSTTSLLFEDLAPLKKSPPKARRRRRIGPAWYKKKKGKGKATDEQLLNERSEGNEYSANDISRLPLNPTENPVARKATGQAHAQKGQESDEPIQKLASPAHSTQVPVVSEGPGQSPRDSEDDSAHKKKEEMSKIELCGKPVEVKTSENPLEKSQPNKTVKQEVTSPRLTRSKLPTVELDPDLLENFGSRKRKPKTDLLDNASQDDTKKPQQQDTKKANQKSKVQSIKPSAKVSTDLLEADYSNTQVPEVSEGPGEVALDPQDKQDHEGKVEVQKPSVRMLRSRSRGSPSTKSTTSAVQDSSDDTKMNQPSQQEEDKMTDRNGIDELESPQSPPPETAEPEAFISSRVTRSKKRSSAYVVVRTTESDLPAVSDVVDSIAGQRLPISKLFVAPPNVSSLASEPMQISNDYTPLIDGEVPPAVQSLNRSQNQPPDESTEEQNQLTAPINSGHTTGEPQAKAVGQQSAHTLVEGGDSKSLGTTSSSKDLQVEKPASESVKPAEEVLDTLKSIIAITSPKKTRRPLNTSSSLLPPPLSSSSIQIPPLSTLICSPPSAVSSILSHPILSTQPAFPAQDLNSILPGTFLNSLFTNTLDTTFSNDINESSLPDDPGDLVIDESDTNEPDVSFWDNLTNADFSDDDNNTDLADKIDKIVKDQIHQDPVPVPTLKTGEKKSQEESLSSKTETDKTASSLNRRDSIDERTGLPNNFLQRLRDPRIRSRLLSHLEEVETGDKTPQTGSVVGRNSLPANIVTSSTVGGPQYATVGNSDPRRKADGDAVSHTSVSSTVGASQASVVPAVSALLTQPVMGVQSETTVSSAVIAVPNTTILTTPLVPSESIVQQPHVSQGTPIESVGNLESPEEPPDPSKVDFLVPPSDEEEDEEECIRRRPKKAKKQVDLELMYKSPLEDLQSENRPAYGERAPRRYGENLPRRKIDDRRARWDDGRSRIDEHRDGRPPRELSRDRRFDRGRDQSRDQRFEDRGRSQSRDRRFEDRGRDQSRDRRSFYDLPPRDHSRDRSYEPNPWPVGEPAYNQPPASPAWVMQHPEAPHWQQNYQPEPNIPPQPIMYFPDLPKIDYMETRLINLELLPKTTNLEVPSIKKIYAQFNKENVQMLQTPPPTYDPNEQLETIQVMDPVTGEIIEMKQDPRPTSGLTKDFFRHVPPDLTLDDVVKFHFISPAYVMVHDNEDDLDSSSDEEEVGSEASSETKFRRIERAERKKRALSIKPLLESPRKQVRETSHDYDPREPHHNPISDLREPLHNPIPDLRDPLKDILENLPYLKATLSMSAGMCQSKPTPLPPPPPEWNDVDLRTSRGLLDNEEPVRYPSPPESNKTRSRSRSPCRRSPSPRRRRRSRSRSVSPESSDMSISSSRSRSRSPSHSRKGSRTSRRRRSRSRSSERSRSRRSSPKRNSSSVSPSRKHRR